MVLSRHVVASPYVILAVRPARWPVGPPASQVRCQACLLRARLLASPLAVSSRLVVLSLLVVASPSAILAVRPSVVGLLARLRAKCAAKRACCEPVCGCEPTCGVEPSCGCN